MSKFLLWRRFSAYTAYTVATFRGSTVATLLSQSGSTVATLYGTLHSRLSRLKTPFNSLVSGSSGNTFPDFAQENEHLREGNDISPVEPHFPDSWELGDEYDEEDYDDWYDDNYEEWWDDDELIPGTNWQRVTDASWEQQAVDEAIADEEPGQYPPNYDPNSGDIPF